MIVEHGVLEGESSITRIDPLSGSLEDGGKILFDDDQGAA